MKWLLLLLWDPVQALDLADATGGIDHGKIIGLFTFLTVFSALLLYVLNRGNLLPLGHTIALISTAYGWASWRVFLKSRAATATEQRIVEDSEVRYPYGPPTYHYHDD
jgi:hypothetical protein